MGERPDEVHAYRVTRGNRAMSWVLSAALVGAGVFGSYHRMELGDSVGEAVGGILAVVLPMLALMIFFGVRLSRMRVTITPSEVQIVDPFRRRSIPFAEIRGRRCHGRFLYLYRRGKSRIGVNENLFQLDDFYLKWKASLYDLDKADRHARKLAGKPWQLDEFLDDSEQHPAIGGPDPSN